MVQEAQSAAPAPQVQSRNPLDISFTDVEALARYVTETGKILPRKYTGMSAKQYRDRMNRQNGSMFE